MNAEPLLEVMEDLAPQALFAEACQLSAAKGWYFGHGSRQGDAAPFWKMDLDGVTIFDRIWEEARGRCEQITGAKLRVLRQYANGHTYGLGGRPHVDDSQSGTYTLLYYPMAEWQDEWEGETVFYNADGEIGVAIRPRPNRAVLFDSRILHAGRAPGRACPLLRVTVAFKLAVIPEEADAAEAFSAAAEGAVRQHIVRVPSERVRRLIADHLTCLGQSVRLPGFRPGKIPLPVLEKRYGDVARGEVMKSLASQAAASAISGAIVTNVDYVDEADETVFRVTSVYPGSLPDVGLSVVRWERLVVAGDVLRETGLTATDLHGFLKQQVLDFLEQQYRFPLPAGAVEKEFSAIWALAQSSGEANEEDAAEFRRLAERRLRLGIVVAELARRQGLAGPDMEDRLVHHLLTQATVVDRHAGLEQLRELGLIG